MRFLMSSIATCLIIVGAAFAPEAAALGLKYVETADGHKGSRTRQLVQWTHTRLVFNKELKRVAVGQDSTLEVEVLGPSEVLALAKKVGRTSLMVWYTDETSETFVFSVVEDMSVLRRALQDIHRKIRIELAPDRAALILRGNVPTIKYRLAAESAARNYLEAGNQYASPDADILLQSSAGNRLGGDANLRVTKGSDTARRSSAIINLIKVDQLPEDIEAKVKQAISKIGGEHVLVQRIQMGDLADNAIDTLTLSGEVKNQIELSRVLNVASRIFIGAESDYAQGGAVRAITDEAGGLLGQRAASGGSRGSLGSIASGSAGGGSGGGNEIRSNIARSTLVSVAGGRILSMIEVRDLPQVRVSVQMHEVQRSRLKTWRPDLSVITDRYQGPLRDDSVNAQASSVENALQLIGGALSNNLQVSTGRHAFDLLFSLLEQEGISRTLSRPTLTVLAGETAVFRAGGEVPVPNAFSPSGFAGDNGSAGNAAGVFSGTEFKAFGVELKVRAMVGADDRITLDVNPTVSLPDTLLTQQIAGSTGSSLNSAAFNVRSIDTSTRLQDGQPLIIGGLVSRDLSDDASFTPGLNQIPLLGKLAESSGKGDSDRELIIVVTPTIVREPRHDVAIWQYPSPRVLLNRAIAADGPSQSKR